MPSRPISVTMFSNTLRGAVQKKHMLTLLRGLDRRYFRLQLVCSPEVASLMAHDIPDDVAVYPLFSKIHGKCQAAFVWRAFFAVTERMYCTPHVSQQFRCVAGGKTVWSSDDCGTPHVREHWRQGLLNRTFLLTGLQVASWTIHCGIGS